MRRTWTTTLFLAAVLLAQGCGDDDGDGDGDSSAIDGGGGDGEDGGGGGGGDGGDDNADAGGGDFEGIPCGDDTCDEAAEECCVGEGGPSCVSKDTCETVTFGCDGPEDCPAADDLCCGNGADGTSCQPAEDCGGGGESPVVCHADEECPEQGDECCIPPQLESGVCRPNCGPA